MTGAKEYAKALFLLSEEEGESEGVFSELEMLSELMTKNPEYPKLLDTPALSKEERLKLIDEAFGSFGQNLLNLIKILAESRSVRIIPKLKDEYATLFFESRGILHAEAITAIPINDEQNAALVKKLENITGKKVIIKNIVDKATLGGVVLRYGGVQLDGSVKTRLDKFEQALTAAVI
jgi:F-type H+-transporting ATPase subunit delta